VKRKKEEGMNMNDLPIRRTDLLITIEFAQSIGGQRHVRKYVVKKPDIIPGPWLRLSHKGWIDFHNSRDVSDQGVRLQVEVRDVKYSQEKNFRIRIIEARATIFTKENDKDGPRGCEPRLETLIANRMDTRFEYLTHLSEVVTPGVSREEIRRLIHESAIETLP
jgi:hypothetical protein